MAKTATPVRSVSPSGAHFDPHESAEHPSIAGAALDLLLTEAGFGSRARFLPGRETVRLLTGLSRRPGRLVVAAPH